MTKPIGGGGTIRGMENNQPIEKTVGLEIGSTSSIETKEGEEFLIDTSKRPLYLPGWAQGLVNYDKKLGIIKWDKDKFKDALFVTDEQISGSENAEKLIKKLKSENVPLLNSNVFEYLRKNKDQIPEEWKSIKEGSEVRIYFGGTIFRNTDGDDAVLSLYWNGKGWNESECYLNANWDDRYQAAVFKE